MMPARWIGLALGCSSVGSTPLAQARAAVTSGNRCTLEWRGSDPVKRIAGASRYATAQAVATTLFTAPAGAIVTTGDKWPDGIAGGGLARIGIEVDGRAWPLLLTPSPANGQDVDLDATTDSYVRGVTQIRHGYLLGGQEAVGRRAYEQLDQAVRS